MAESSLSIGLPTFRREVSDFLGFGYDYDNDLTADEKTKVNFIIDRGYRQFLNPPLVSRRKGELYKHEWSFLTPKTTVAITANTTLYNLPDDFGGFYDNLTFNSSSYWNTTVEIVDEGRIRDLRAMDLTAAYTARPQLAAVRPRDHAGTTGTRWELLIWPEPDAAYTLVARYYVLQSQMTDAKPYPLGGPNHAELILQSMLAIAEQREDEESSTQKQLFVEMLETSVFSDLQRMTPETIGYNGDNSQEGSDHRKRYNRSAGNHLVTLS